MDAAALSIASWGTSVVVRLVTRSLRLIFLWSKVTRCDCSRWPLRSPPAERLMPRTPPNPDCQRRGPLPLAARKGGAGEERGRSHRARLGRSAAPGVQARCDHGAGLVASLLRRVSRAAPSPPVSLRAALGIEEADALQWMTLELSTDNLFAGGSALRRLTDASAPATTPKGTHPNVRRTHPCMQQAGPGSVPLGVSLVHPEPLTPFPAFLPQPRSNVDSQVTRFIATEFVSGPTPERETPWHARARVGRRPSMLLARPHRTGRSGSLAVAGNSQGGDAHSDEGSRSPGGPSRPDIARAGTASQPSLRRITTALYGVQRAAHTSRSRARSRNSVSEMYGGAHGANRWAVHGSDVGGPEGGSAVPVSLSSIAWATAHYSPTTSSAEGTTVGRRTRGHSAPRSRADSEVDEEAVWRESSADSTSDPGYLHGATSDGDSPALGPRAAVAAMVAPLLAPPQAEHSSDGGGGSAAGALAPTAETATKTRPHSTTSQLVARGSPALVALFGPGGGHAAGSGKQPGRPALSPTADGHPNSSWLKRTAEMESRLRAASSTFRATSRGAGAAHAEQGSNAGSASDGGTSPPPSPPPVQVQAVRLSETGTLGSGGSKSSPHEPAMLRPEGVGALAAPSGSSIEGDADALLVLPETDVCEFWLGDDIAKLREEQEGEGGAAAAAPSRALFPAVFALNSCVPAAPCPAPIPFPPRSIHAALVFPSICRGGRRSGPGRGRSWAPAACLHGR